MTRSQRLRGDALVVAADGGQAVLGGAVAGDVHQRSEPYCSVPSWSKVANEVPA